MARYLIEVPHGNKRKECLQSIAIFMNSGSHFLTNAEWGCHDGEHKAWFMMDADSKEEARTIIPPAYRERAKIMQIERFRKEEFNEIMNIHPD